MNYLGAEWSGLKWVCPYPWLTHHTLWEGWLPVRIVWGYSWPLRETLHADEFHQYWAVCRRVWWYLPWERKQNTMNTEMAYLNYRRNMRYTTTAPRDTIAFVLCVLCLFARNNKPLKCQKGYRLCNSTHSIFYHGRQVMSVFNTQETFPKPQ